MVDGLVDIRIAYLKQQELPLEVRPAATATAVATETDAGEPQSKRQRLQ
jgi:hypothetical protein